MNATTRRIIGTAVVVGVSAGTVCSLHYQETIPVPVQIPKTQLQVELERIDARLLRIIEKIEEYQKAQE